MSYSSDNVENNYLLTQAIGNFIVDPAYLATLSFLQNPDLSNNASQLCYTSMVTSIDSFLLQLNSLPQYSANPVIVQVGLAGGSAVYVSSKQNTIENASNGTIVDNLSSRPEFSIAIKNSLQRVYTGFDYDIYPSPLAPLPVPGDLVFVSRYTRLDKEFRSYVAEAITGKFTTNNNGNTGYDYIPMGAVVFSIPLVITGLPLVFPKWE